MQSYVVSCSPRFNMMFVKFINTSTHSCVIIVPELKILQLLSIHFLYLKTWVRLRLHSVLLSWTRKLVLSVVCKSLINSWASCLLVFRCLHWYVCWENRHHESSELLVIMSSFCCLVVRLSRPNMNFFNGLNFGSFIRCFIHSYQ